MLRRYFLLKLDGLLIANVAICLIFISLAVFCLLSGTAPIHDAIFWQGAYHYFYTSIQKGIIPYWNPYSQTGTPFFVNYQNFGLLEPSSLFFIYFQKFTGCSTLTAYLLLYLFYYFIFIMGTFYVIRFLTKSNKIALLFSLVLFFASFPIFMRQNGALLPFFLMPFITFFILMFFQESNINKKGFYLFIFSFLLGVSLNIYIPTGIILYLLLFFILVLLIKIIRIRQVLPFIRSKNGVIWIILSIIVILLISMPVLALYDEFHNNKEIFPTVRIIQKNYNNLVKLYASDTGSNILSQDFTNNLKVSITLGNLIGMILEPFNIFRNKIDSSEIRLYVGIFPLLFAFLAILKNRSKYTWLFSGISIFILFLMCNFKTRITAPASIFQNMIGYILPFTKSIEVLQNTGVIFLFCFIILGAIGFSKISRDEMKNLIVANLVLLFLSVKLFLFMVYLFPSFGFLVFISIAFIVLYLINFRQFLIKAFYKTNNRFIFINKIKIMPVIIVIIFLDLISFNIYYYSKLENNFYRSLKNENIVKAKTENPFINYRQPFSLPKDYQPLGFFGHEFYSLEKVAFPYVLKFSHLVNKQFGYHQYPLYDHFYMTKYYYDYLVNVDIDKQLATSSIIFPILNFFPLENARFVKDKYEVVKQINQTSIQDLGKYIFIEKDQKTTPKIINISEFFNPQNYLRYNDKELADFEKNLGLRYPQNNNVFLKIKEYNINKLSLVIDAPEHGYLYFGDGYSRHWKAFVDNKKTKIEKTNINFKSIYLLKGRHDIKFIYDPVIFRYALYLYFTGIITVLGILAIYLLYIRKATNFI